MFLNDDTYDLNRLKERCRSKSWSKCTLLLDILNQIISYFFVSVLTLNDIHPHNINFKYAVRKKEKLSAYLNWSTHKI